MNNSEWIYCNLSYKKLNLKLRQESRVNYRFQLLQEAMNTFNGSHSCEFHTVDIYWVPFVEILVEGKLYSSSWEGYLNLFVMMVHVFFENDQNFINEDINVDLTKLKNLNDRGLLERIFFNFGYDILRRGYKSFKLFNILNITRLQVFLHLHLIHPHLLRSIQIRVLIRNIAIP